MFSDNPFLGATKHLYNWLCPSVGWSVCRSVTHSFDDPHVAPIGLLGLVFFSAVSVFPPGLTVALWRHKAPKRTSTSSSSSVPNSPSGHLARIVRTRMTASASRRSSSAENNADIISAWVDPSYSPTAKNEQIWNLRVIGLKNSSLTEITWYAY